MQGNNKITTIPIPNSPIIDVHPHYNSDSSQDDESFLCSKTERHNNLPFGDLITTPKKKHTQILFQNVNSLEVSFGHHTLELICDSIGKL